MAQYRARKKDKMQASRVKDRLESQREAGGMKVKIAIKKREASKRYKQKKKMEIEKNNL